MLVAHALVLARRAGGGTNVDDANLLVALAGVALQGRLRLFADLDAVTRCPRTGSGALCRRRYRCRRCRSPCCPGRCCPPGSVAPVRRPGCRHARCPRTGSGARAGGGTDVDDTTLFVALAGVALQGRLCLFADLDAAIPVAHALVLARCAGGGTGVDDAASLVTLAGVAFQRRLRLIGNLDARSLVVLDAAAADLSCGGSSDHQACRRSLPWVFHAARDAAIRQLQPTRPRPPPHRLA